MLKSISLSARRRLAAWLLSALVVLAGTSEPVRQLCTLPDSIELTCGYSAQLRCAMPLVADVVSGDQAVAIQRDQALADVGGVALNAQSEGLATISLKLMGLFPIKQVEVQVAPERILVPGGQAVGVAIQVQGVLVVGASDLGGSLPSPARLAGLKAGDVIEKVNGSAVMNAQHLTELLAGGAPAMLTVRRGDSALEIAVTPALDPRDGSYRLGLWVRDSTAGVGTLSFYDPESRSFGALGHAITDVDTGSLLVVRDGEITQSEITGVRRGERGAPGELISEFAEDAPSLGDIALNNAFGIYGNAQQPITNPLYPDGMAMMRQGEVQLGKAQILTTLDARGIAAYDCEIVKLTAQNGPAPRSFVVRIIDPELLAQTGGIVQGMSGSPVVQDGRLIGAVTHVYVNDPTMGYGVYIEWMLDQFAEQAT